MTTVTKSIHIIIGTKAQFIKMVPVMKGFESRGITYNYINLGQHGATVEKLLKQSGVRSSELGGCAKRDVTSLFGVLIWLIGHLVTIIFRGKYLKKQVFKGRKGVALIHGDTASSLIGLLMAKRAGLKIAHVESGLRSWSYFHPFPEELIRVVCMRWADYLFAPSDGAIDNLHKMKVRGEVFHTGGNTGIDAARLIGETAIGSEDLKARGKPYVLFSVHRFENLYSRKRFGFITDIVDEISKRFNVIFVMHGPTERKLNKLKTGISLKNQARQDQIPVGTRITYLPLQDYPEFLKMIHDAEFVITDGGSVQEECYYFGKPCLIMRKRTERTDGIGRNAVLGKFDIEVINNFFNSYKEFQREQWQSKESPSEKLTVEILKRMHIGGSA